MKKQILMLIIGILIGAIITTGVFLVLKGDIGEQEGRMNGGERMEMNGELPSMDGETPGRGKEGIKSENSESTQNTQDTTNTSESDV